MKRTIDTTDLNKVTLEEDNHIETRKTYTEPKLTHYGDIASLVLALVTNGQDGGGVPFQRPS